MTIMSQLRVINRCIESYFSSNLHNQIVLWVYFSANAGVFAWGAYAEYQDSTRFYGHRQSVANAAARGGGFTITFNCSFILILASRRLLTTVRNYAVSGVLPLNKGFPAGHRLIGYFIGAGTAFHSPIPLARVVIYREWDEFSWGSTSMTVYTGIGLFIVFIIIGLSSVLRKRWYRLFHITHIFGSEIFFILLVLHGAHRKHPQTYKFVLPGMIIYALDRIWRRLTISSFVLELSGDHFTLKGEKLLEITVPKEFEYKAGQYAEIHVPILGYEWHPFSIVSAPAEEKLSFLIKVQGDWTSKLHNSLQEQIKDSNIPNLEVQIRGPYGAPSDQFDRFSKLILISGGIGATPFAAIAKQVHGRNQDQPNQDPSSKNGIDPSRDHTIIDMGPDYGNDAVIFQDELDGFSRVRDLLSSSRMTFILLVSIIVRLALVAVISIFDCGTFDFFAATVVPSAYWALFTEALLSLAFLGAMTSTIFVDIYFMSTGYFCNPVRCLNFIVFIPGSILSTMISIISWLNPTSVVLTFSIVHFAVYLPLVFILLVYRMSVLNEGRTMKRFSCMETGPEVDFIWTVRKGADDEWLREELAGTSVNLHRFVTGEGEDIETNDGIRSLAGRPDWISVLQDIVSTQTCPRTVGVFFCGPRKMGAAIRRAVREVEVLSYPRDDSSATNNNTGIARDSNDNWNHNSRSRLHVRLVFHEEKF